MLGSVTYVFEEEFHRRLFKGSFENHACPFMVEVRGLGTFTLILRVIQIELPFTLIRATFLACPTERIVEKSSVLGLLLRSGAHI